MVRNPAWQLCRVVQTTGATEVRDDRAGQLQKPPAFRAGIMIPYQLWGCTDAVPIDLGDAQLWRFVGLKAYEFAPFLGPFNLSDAGSGIVRIDNFAFAFWPSLWQHSDMQAQVIHSTRDFWSVFSDEYKTLRRRRMPPPFYDWDVQLALALHIPILGFLLLKDLMQYY